MVTDLRGQQVDDPWMGQCGNKGIGKQTAEGLQGWYRHGQVPDPVGDAHDQTPRYGVIGW